MTNKSFSIKARLISFKYAFKGIKHVVVHEHNARVHLLATLIVISLGFYCNINRFEWIAITLVIALVWITEMLNTIIELLVNHLWPQYNITAGKIKDIAAAIVLLCAFASVVIACIIFIPKLI